MSLVVEDLCVEIQASRILHGAGLEVREGEVVCLVGRNGAGKTTTLRTIMGYFRPREGRVLLRGQEINGMKPHEVAQLGVGLAPEESEVFGSLTVHENILVPTWTRPTGRPPNERIEAAYTVFPALRRYRDRKGSQMSGGERKMLSIARALALDPQLLLLDEPFEGLSPAIIPTVSEGVGEIARKGCAILMAESNIHHVPDFADRLYIIERGEIVFSGRPEDAEGDEVVRTIVRGAG